MKMTINDEICEYRDECGWIFLLVDRWIISVARDYAWCILADAVIHAQCAASCLPHVYISPRRNIILWWTRALTLLYLCYCASSSSRLCLRACGISQQSRRADWWLTGMHHHHHHHHPTRNHLSRALFDNCPSSHSHFFFCWPSINSRKDHHQDISASESAILNTFTFDKTKVF